VKDGFIIKLNKGVIDMPNDSKYCPNCKILFDKKKYMVKSLLYGESYYKCPLCDEQWNAKAERKEEGKRRIKRLKKKLELLKEKVEELERSRTVKVRSRLGQG